MPTPEVKGAPQPNQEVSSFLQQVSSEEDRDEIWRKISTCSNSTSENNTFESPHNKARDENNFEDKKA